MKALSDYLLVLALVPITCKVYILSIKFVDLLSFLILEALRWHLNKVFDGSYTYSEKFMFGDGNGPFILEQGDAYISAESSLTI